MASKLDGLHPIVMRPRVEGLLAEPRAKALGLHVVSGFRPISRQRVLFNARVALEKRLDPGISQATAERRARKWVAYPGRSNHGPSLDAAGNKVADQLEDGMFGGAVDLGLPGVKAVSGQWPPDIVVEVDALAAMHGLFSPMDWEDWHYEPIKGWKPVAPAQDPRRIVDELDCDPDFGWKKGDKWVLQADGGVITRGRAPFYGSYPGLPADLRIGSRTFKKITPFRGGYALVSTKNEWYHFPAR